MTVVTDSMSDASLSGGIPYAGALRAYGTLVHLPTTTSRPLTSPAETSSWETPSAVSVEHSVGTHTGRQQTVS